MLWWWVVYVWSVGLWCAVVWVRVSVSPVVGVDGVLSFVGVFGVLWYALRYVCVFGVRLYDRVVTWCFFALCCARDVVFWWVVWWRCVFGVQCCGCGAMVVW